MKIKIPPCPNNTFYFNVTSTYKNINQSIIFPYVELLHAAIKSKQIYK